MAITVTIIIIAFTCLVSFMAWRDPSLMNKLVDAPAVIKERGEWYRLLSSGFVHKDEMHLIFNMYALYIFGSQIGEGMFTAMFGKPLGGVAFLIFYLLGIVAANIVTYFRHQDNFGYVGLGASGGVSAVMWPFIMFAPWNWFIFPPLPAIVLGIGYIFYSDYMDRRGKGTVGHSAHLWGAIFGLVVYVALAAAFQPGILEYFWQELMQPQGPNWG